MTDRPNTESDDDRRFVLFGGDVTGERGMEVDRSVEPGAPTLEHVLFVLLGALATILVFLEAVGLL